MTMDARNMMFRHLRVRNFRLKHSPQSICYKPCTNQRIVPFPFTTAAPNYQTWKAWIASVHNALFLNVYKGRLRSKKGTVILEAHLASPSPFRKKNKTSLAQRKVLLYECDAYVYGCVCRDTLQLHRLGK